MEQARLDKALALELIRRLSEHISYSISIMDCEGVIIASRDGDRLGAFNEAAYRLVAAGSSVESIFPGDNLLSGAVPGVYLPIVLRGETIGVVGVKGDPKEVEPVAYAVKSSVETTVEHELFKEHTIRQLDTKNLFLNYLLYENETPRTVVEGLAAKLGYEPAFYRVPILMRLPEGIDADSVLAAVKRNGIHTAQDISYATLDGALLVFKTVRFAGPGVVSEYEAQTSEYVSAASAAASARCGAGLSRACVGSYQKDFKYYRAAYRHVLWLAGHVADRPPDAAPVFFYNYVLEYLTSRVPRPELCQIFGATAELLPPDFVRIMRDSVEALSDSAFNAKEAAGRLNIHRNTLTARLERIKELFGVDVRWNAPARDFLSMLTRYLRLPGARAESK